MTTLGQVRNKFPAVRIFVFGVEVTEDVLSNNLNWHDGRAPNVAEFVLANPYNKYTLTENDIRLLYADVKDVDILSQYDSVLNTTSTNLPTATVSTSIVEQDRVNNAFPPNSIKGRVLYQKIGIRQTVSQPSIAEQIIRVSNNKDNFALENTLHNEGQIKAFVGDAPRYPFQLGDPIFHSNDVVRIFWRDLDDPTIWFHAFAGFVTDHVVTLRPNGESTLTLRCEDVLRIFRYSRIALNPSMFDIAAVRTSQDIEFQAFYKDGFAGLNLPQVISILMFGSTATGLDGSIGVSVETGEQATLQGAALPGYTRIGVNGQTSSPSITNGIGAFNFDDSRVFVYGPLGQGTETPESIPTGLLGQIIGDDLSQIISDEVSDSDNLTHSDRVAGIKVQPIETLARYQAEIDHKVYTDDLATLLGPNVNPSLAASLIQSITPQGLAPGQPGSYPAIADVITLIGTHPEVWPVDFGRLVMLLPSTLGNSISSAIIHQDLIDSFATTTKFNTRLAMIYNMVERIEFDFYASPRGDVIVEFPLYDFKPEDFGKVEFDFTPVRSDSDLVPSIEKRGPFSQRYTVTRKDITGWEKGFSDEHVRTQVRCSYLAFPGHPELGSSTQLGMPPGVATLEALIPSFGVRSEEVDPKGYIGSQAAASVYSNIKLNQLNADAQSAKIEVIPRLGIGPNRPMKFVIHENDSEKAQLLQAFVATVRSVNLSMVWNSSVGMTIGCNYVRNWDGQLGADNSLLFSPLGGFASRPLNYNLIFNGAVAATNTPSTTASAVGAPVNTTTTNNVIPQTSYKSQATQSLTTASSVNDLARQARLAEARSIANQTASVLVSSNIKGVVTSVDTSAARNELIARRATENPTRVNLQAQQAVLSGRDPHADGRAFDISGVQGSTNADIFSALTGGQGKTSADGSEIVGTVLVPNDFGIPAGATVIHEVFNNHVHVQWSAGSHKESW